MFILTIIFISPHLYISQPPLHFIQQQHFNYCSKPLHTSSQLHSVLSMTSQYPSDYEILAERFKSQGYQRGLDEMDETILQSSFNVGFVHGVSTRFGKGYTRGLSTGMLLSSMLLKPALNPTTLPISKNLTHDDAADTTDQCIHPTTSQLLSTPNNAKNNFNTFEDELDSLPNALPAAKKAPKTSAIVHYTSIVPNFLPSGLSSAQTSLTSSSQPVSSPDSDTTTLKPFQHNIILKTLYVYYYLKALFFFLLVILLRQKLVTIECLFE